MLSSFSNAKQTRSSTDSHINVLACKREKENASHTIKKWPGSNVQKETGKCICEKSERKRPKWLRVKKHKALNPWKMSSFFFFLKHEALNSFIYIEPNTVRGTAFWIDWRMNHFIMDAFVWKLYSPPMHFIKWFFFSIDKKKKVILRLFVAVNGLNRRCCNDVNTSNLLYSMIRTAYGSA